MNQMEKMFVCDSKTALVKTKRGKVKGYVYDGMEIFKGIPYAKAARFHAPEEVPAWDGILDATSYGYVCPLMESDKPTGELKVPHRYWLMDEDCQNLNIWTPGCDGQKRPVMVWLHGGGFWAGSSIEQVAYEGGNMCRFGQVVVVSLNHRLNILGYLDLSDFGEDYKNSGNAGTADIIAALKWIHDNIAAFGGDPENVTLFGQSGGGAKIMTLLQSPEADGLYAKGIIMSGVGGTLMADSTGSGRKIVEEVMKELHTRDVRDLETVPYTALAAAYNAVKPALEKAGEYTGGTPQPNAFYAGEAVKHGFRPETAKVPLLIGSVFGEFGAFAPPQFDKNKMTRDEEIQKIIMAVGKTNADKLIPLFEAAYPERHLTDMLTQDFVFRKPGQEYISQRSGLNACTYSYMFNLDLPIDGGSLPWHCADIPYVFRNTALVPVTQEAGVTEKVEKRIFDTVMAFAYTGNPNNKEIPFWPPSTPEKEQVMVFGKDADLRCNYDRELVGLLEQCLKEAFESAMQNTDIQH